MLVQDAARRRRAEYAVRQLSQLQTAILDCANYSIISTTPDGTIRSLKAAAQLWQDYEPEDLVGEASLTQLHDPRRSRDPRCNAFARDLPAGRTGLRGVRDSRRVGAGSRAGMDLCARSA
jgi:PAS domain-containing protein